MPTFNQAGSTSDTHAQDCVTTAGFSLVDSQRSQEFSREEMPVAGSQASAESRSWILET